MGQRWICGAPEQSDESLTVGGTLIAASLSLMMSMSSENAVIVLFATMTANPPTGCQFRNNHRIEYHDTD
jgi:hypothetical protein